MGELVGNIQNPGEAFERTATGTNTVLSESVHMAAVGDLFFSCSFPFLFRAILCLHSPMNAYAIIFSLRYIYAASQSHSHAYAMNALSLLYVVLL